MLQEVEEEDGVEDAIGEGEEAGVQADQIVGPRAATRLPEATRLRSAPKTVRSGRSRLRARR